MFRAARIDENQPDIVKVLRESGWTVLIISQLKNCCDIIISKNGRTVAVEIKDGSKAPSLRKLTKGEKEFRDNWQGEYRLVLSINDALSI